MILKFCSRLWPESWSIAEKELFPIVVSAAVWGKNWARSSVVFVCDNLAVVQALSSRLVRDPGLMHMLRCLFFEAHFKFEHTARHIPGRDNTAADALSRNCLAEFFSLHPQAPQLPASIPLQLVGGHSHRHVYLVWVPAPKGGWYPDYCVIVFSGHFSVGYFPAT